MDEALYKLAVTYLGRRRNRPGGAIFSATRARLSEQRLRRKIERTIANYRREVPQPNPERMKVLPPEKKSFLPISKTSFSAFTR
jgi:hypothetical protein